MGLFDWLTGGNDDRPEAPNPYTMARADYRYNNFDTHGADGSGTRYGYTDRNGVFRRGTPPRGTQAAVRQIEGTGDRRQRELMEGGAFRTARGILGAPLARRPGAPNLVGRNGYSMPTLPTLGRTRLTDRLNRTDLGGIRLHGRKINNDELQARDRSDVADDVYERGISLLEPQIEKSGNQLLESLQARGLPIGGDAFNDAYGSHTRETQGTLARLALDANIEAGDEQSREFALDQAGRQFYRDGELAQFGVDERVAGFGRDTALAQHGINKDVATFGRDTKLAQHGIDVDVANYGSNRARSLFDMRWANARGMNDVRSQQFGLRQDARSAGLEELMGLFGGSYSPQSRQPTAPSGGSNIGGYMQDHYASELGQYESDRQNRSNMWGTIGSLAGSFLLCDRNLKEVLVPADPEAALEAALQIPVSFFLYTDEGAELMGYGLEHRPTHMGPMAQDFHEATGLGDGHQIPMVDAVGLLLGALQGAVAKMDRMAGRIEDLEARLAVGSEQRAA